MRTSAWSSAISTLTVMRGAGFEGKAGAQSEPLTARVRAELVLVERHALHERREPSLEVWDCAVASDFELEVARLVTDRDEAAAHAPIGRRLQRHFENAVGHEVDTGGQVDRVAKGLSLARESGLPH